MISIIAAISNNNVIGKDGGLPWHLPSDLKYFKDLTKGKIVVMGRKCWDSLPDKFKPLPDRLNIVITRTPNISIEGAIVVTDVDNTLKGLNKTDSDVFVIGGGEIYKQSLKYAENLYLTRIYSDVDGDTFFEGFNESGWNLRFASKIHEENGFKFQFEVYDKNNH